MLENYLESFFLPSGSHWSSEKKLWHLLIPIPFAILLISIRKLCDNYIFGPIGTRIGIKDTRTKPPITNNVLESFYQKNRRLYNAEMLSKRVDMTPREIEVWWLARRDQDKPTILNKFNETSFKGACYTINFYYGLIILWNKPYLWNLTECFKDYPMHPLTNHVWWHYMLVLALYWHLAIEHFYEPRRIDFYPMLLHHITALTLIGFWYICNLHRFFHLFLVLMDIVEYILHWIKAFKYAKYERLAQICYVIFVIFWTPTRLLICPYVIFKFGTEISSNFGTFPAYWILLCLLLIIQGLHIFWTYLIYKVLFVALRGNLDDAKDIRSDDED